MTEWVFIPILQERKLSFNDSSNLSKVIDTISIPFSNTRVAHSPELGWVLPSLPQAPLCFS